MIFIQQNLESSHVQTINISHEPLASKATLNKLHAQQLEQTLILTADYSAKKFSVNFCSNSYYIYLRETEHVLHVLFISY